MQLKANPAYLDIVTPIILDAAQLARGEKKISDIDRTGLNIKLILFKYAPTNLAAIYDSNLNQNLPIILAALNESRRPVNS
jgi:hypothetical protein